VTGVITFGLSNPYQNTFFYAIGVGVEILLEAPTGQSRLTGPNGAMTGASISDSWMFAIVHEIGHQCFALGLQIRQLLEKLHVLSVEIGGITLPEEYLDPETGRCCVLLGHLGDPDVPRGFNVTVPHQHQWILQSVLFVPARLLTFEQCLSIRKDGTEARRKLAEGFVKTKHFHLCDVPPASWNKLTKAASPSTDPATAPAAASSSSSSSSAVSSAPAAASSSSGPIKTVVKK
jgi:hypothetical protein